jgi:hypothetical protein
MSKQNSRRKVFQPRFNSSIVGIDCHGEGVHITKDIRPKPREKVVFDSTKREQELIQVICSNSPSIVAARIMRQQRLKRRCSVNGKYDECGDRKCHCGVQFLPTCRGSTGDIRGNSEGCRPLSCTPRKDDRRSSDNLTRPRLRRKPVPNKTVPLFRMRRERRLKKVRNSRKVNHAKPRSSGTYDRQPDPEIAVQNLILEQRR